MAEAGARIVREVIENTFVEFLRETFEIDDEMLLDRVSKDFVKSCLEALLTVLRQQEQLRATEIIENEVIKEA